MATFITKPNKIKKKYYYAKIQNSEWLKPKFISLGDGNTSYKEARRRYRIIENEFEKEIKQGVEFESYGWEENSKGKAKQRTLTFEKLVEMYINEKKVFVSESTIKRERNSFNLFMKYQGKTFPPNKINNKHIVDFTKILVKKGYYNNGINIVLRNLKSLFIWSVEEEHMTKRPKIKMLQVSNKIKYIKDSDWSKIMDLDINTIYKNAFIVLRGIGVRRSDLCLGNIKGNMLYINSDDEKTRKYKEIELTDLQVGLVQQFHDYRDAFLAKGRSIDTLKRKLTRVFQDCCKQIGIYEPHVTTLHCLRDTFAVRTWIKTGDIYLVKELLCHNSVTTTEKYTKIKLPILKQDFKKLYERLENRLNNTPNSTTPSIKYNNPRLYH